MKTEFEDVIKDLKLTKNEIALLARIKSLKTVFSKKGLHEKQYDELEELAEELKVISVFDVRV